jgi:quercetin dioxygenase-like cupin family protein
MENYNWNGIKSEEINALCSRKVIHTPKVTILQVTFKKGAAMSSHTHVHEQVTMLTAGSLRVVLDGEEIILRAGDVLRIPSNAPHSVEALEDSTGTDVFSPAREDWIQP